MTEKDTGHPIVSETRNPQRVPGNVGWLDYAFIAIAAVAVLAIGLYSWWTWRAWQEPSVVSVPSPPPQRVAPVERPDDSAPPAIRYPVEAAGQSASARPSLDESDLELSRLLEGILGRERMAQLRMTHFVRNFVATVDNLARSRAPSHVWPVNSAGGRFATSEEGGRLVVGADNELRYAPFVLLAESADATRLVALYRSTYPLFQQAYEELGYPGKYFNDRLVAVIDHLLAAPEPPGPLVLDSVEVRGPMPLTRPWVHHVFADPQLEALSAGQKIMVRVGAANERRLKAQLKRFREALTGHGESR